jgi:tetratricopeptide (TPR) repeat protein
VTEHPYVLLQKGRKLLSENHPHQAALLLERAATAEPRKASIREALARAYYNSGQWRRAREQFAMVIDLNPSNAYAHFGLAMSLARVGDRAVAIGHLKMAITMRPESAVYREALERLRG